MEKTKIKDFVEENTICSLKKDGDSVGIIAVSGEYKSANLEEFLSDNFMKTKAVIDFEKLFNLYTSESKRLIIRVNSEEESDTIISILKPNEQDFVSYCEDGPISKKKSSIVIEMTPSLNKELVGRLIKSITEIVERKIKTHSSLTNLYKPNIVLEEDTNFILPDITFVDKDIRINEYISDSSCYVDLESIKEKHNSEVESSSALQIKFDV